MFGRFAFSQAPFGGQANSKYELSLTEGLTVADSNSERYAFVASITEALSLIHI